MPDVAMKKGEWYTFIVGNLVKIPESEPHYILTDSGGVKYLLPAAPYADYGFNTGDTLRCRVDKINCSGRIFLEPEHHWYKEGKDYSFVFLRKEVFLSVLGKIKYCWILGDIKEKEILLEVGPEFYNEEPGRTIDCRLERIKKGKLFLRHPYSALPPVPDLTGSWLSLVILPELVQYNQNACFVLAGESGNKFLLRKKYYQHYGLVPGEKLQCKVVKWHHEGFWVLEPLHPMYREGETYFFTIIELDRTASEDESRFFVLDNDNNKILVTAPREESFSPGVEIRLLVTEIRKATPVLKWIRQD